MNHHWDSY